MNLDELQSVQSRERQATSLQNLRSSFYQDAGEFIQELERERDRAAERADDPFSSPEVRRLTDDIETAKQTVEAIYERRVGKVVKMASIAAADMPTDDEGLTEEEAALFETLVERIKQNRSHVLEEVLEGEGTDISCTREAAVDPAGDATPAESDPIPGGDPAADSTPSPADPEQGSSTEVPEEVPPEPPSEAPPEPPAEDASGAESVNAADMMAGASESESPKPPEAAASDPEPTAEPPSPASPSRQSGTDSSAGGESAAEHEPETEPESVDRATVRITKNIGEIFGVDERSYDLSSDDVVTLPEANAEPLLQRDAAERLD